MLPPIPDPIPENNPTWRAYLVLLAQALVEQGAKPKLIRHFTFVSERDLSQICKLRQDAPSLRGPIIQGSASYFTTANNSRDRSGWAWNIQGSIMLSCYQAVAAATAPNVNRGWLLLQAHRAYLAMTEKLHQETGCKRLDINAAHALMAIAQGEYADIGQYRCRACEREYMIDRSREVQAQPCPFCALAAIRKRLERNNAVRYQTRKKSPLPR